MCRARLSTVPYVLMLNGLVWPGNSQLAANGSPAVVGPSVEVMENALNAQGLDVTLYRGSDIPIYAALSFVNYLSANIQYQDMPAVQRSVQSYVSASICKFTILNTSKQLILCNSQLRFCP